MGDSNVGTGRDARRQKVNWREEGKIADPAYGHRITRLVFEKT
jgi:hypothetical protein